MPAINPLLLLVLDGWGLAAAHSHNAITQAQPDFFNQLWHNFPHASLSASGTHVGLPADWPGNTDAGFLTLGMGDPPLTSPALIESHINSGEFFNHPHFLKLKPYFQTNPGIFHIVTHIGGFHSERSMKHLYAVLRMCSEQQLHNCAVHAILSGSANQPAGSLEALLRLQQTLIKNELGRLVSITGAHWIRDQHGPQLQPFCDLFRGKPAKSSHNLEHYLRSTYLQGIYEEYIPPTYLQTDAGSNNPPLPVKPSDIIYFNEFSAKGWEGFIELLAGKSLPDYNAPPQKNSFPPAISVSLGPLHSRITALYPETVYSYSLGEQIAGARIPQLRMTLKSKQASVTQRLNGNHPQQFSQEVWQIIEDSHLEPIVALNQLTKEAISKIAIQFYPFITINIPTVDNIAHTGDLQQTIAACKHVDGALQRVVTVAKQKGYTVIIAADHGHAEHLNCDNTRFFDHTTNQVPCVVIPAHTRNSPHINNLKTISDLHPFILSTLLPKQSYSNTAVPIHTLP